MSTEDTYNGTDNLVAMAAARRYNAFLTNLINRYAPLSGTIVDFGAGVGTFSQTTESADRTIICVEPDPNQSASLKLLGFDVHQSTQTIADESCDFIYSLNVIEHIEDDGAAIKELFRILKPGGSILIYVPAMEALYSSMDKKVGHFRRYSRKGLRDLLSRNAFAVKTAAYADSLGYFATLAYKWGGNTSGDLNMTGLVLYDRYLFPLSRLLDLLTYPFFGKNVFAVAIKPEGMSRETLHPRA